jgi:pimeloyl-ACP methyl ester carboxylesterase
MRDGFTSTRHGRIHFLEAGSGRPIFLLHSNGNSAYEYEDVMKILAARNRVIAWDQPGHGDSDRITRHHSVEDYSDAVVDCMQSLGLARASVLGASIGGAIATDLGARHAACIDRLFIVEAPVRTPEEWASRWLSTEQNYCFPTQSAQQLAPRLRKVTDQLLERWNLDRNKAGAWTMLDVMWALRDYDVRTAMAKVAAKTLVLYGDKSPVGAGAKAFEQTVPGARLVIMKDCGHFPMLDDPAGLAKVINDFLDL